LCCFSKTQRGYVKRNNILGQIHTVYNLDILHAHRTFFTRTKIPLCLETNFSWKLRNVTVSKTKFPVRFYFVSTYPHRNCFALLFLNCCHTKEETRLELNSKSLISRRLNLLSQH